MDNNERDYNILEENTQLREKLNELSGELDSLRKEKTLIESYYNLFDIINIPLCEFDVKDLRLENKRLKEEGGIQIEKYFADENTLLRHVSLMKLKKVNKELIKLFEAEDEEDLIQNFYSIASPQSVNGIRARQIAFFNEETYFEDENTYQTLKGNKINVIEKIYFPPNLRNIVIVSVHDITKDKLLENELKSNKENYRFLFEHSPAMIIEYNLSEIKKYYLSLNISLNKFKALLMDDSSGILEEAFKRLIISDVNDTAFKLLKAPNKKDVIEHFDKYHTIIATKDFIENVILVFEGRLENQFESKLQTSEGNTIDVLITWQVVPGHEKTHSKIFLIIVDITERKEINKQLLEMQKLDSLGLLAGGIAHDLNNLLVPILGSINLVQSSIEINQDIQNHLKRMEETTLRATELIKQLLTYSGKGKFLTEVCNLNNIIHKIDYLISLTATKKVTVGYELDDSLPPIEADETQIQQVVMNLVSNAVMAMDYSGRIKIETSSKFFSQAELNKCFNNFSLTEGNFVLLKIIDQGRGIDEAIKEKIFDPFFSTKEGGRGLGLSVVLGIVKTHKGGIRTDSELRKGSTFTVIFPISKFKSRKRKYKDSIIEGKEITKSVKVLVCDDELSVREITSLMVKRLGLDVLEAESGAEALDIIKNDNIDMLFLDLTMPGMDGVTVVKEIRKINKKIPIILMSGYNEHEIELRLSGTKIDGFMQKPFTMDSLKSKLVNLS